MIPEITQKNLYLLLPGKVTDVVKIYADEMGCSYQEALKKFYTSKTYKSLEKESTKFWHLGPVALYEELIYEG